MTIFRIQALALLLVAGILTAAAAQDSRDSASGRVSDDQNSPDRQNDQSPLPTRGFNEYENFRGMVNSSGNLLKLDSTIGYDFNSHVGVFAGLPLYFANGNGSIPGQTRLSDFGAGDVYFGLEGFLPTRMLNFSSRLTGTGPTGSVGKGFSPGQPTLDWTNRFRRRFSRLAPFVSFGVGNTVPDSELVTRNFVSVGNIVHFEEGTDLDVVRHVYVGGSAYQIIPFGQQRVFNQLETFIPRGGNEGSNHDDHNGGPAPNQPPPGNSGQPSATGNDLTREHGFDAWLGFEPTRILRLELGYSRSISFNLNSFSFNLGLNVGRLLRGGRMH
jgi:hypothetical protein